MRRLRRDAPLVLLDLAIVVSAYLLTLVIRFEGSVPGFYWHNIRIYLPLICITHLAVNQLFGLYGQMWRYASVLEARRVALAGLTSGGFLIAADTIAGLSSLKPVPISVMILGGLISLMGFGTVRFQSRLFANRRVRVQGVRKRVLVMGAGDAGAMILKDILENSGIGIHPVAIIDDDPRKTGRRLYEIPIVGTRADIPTLASQLDVDQVLMAIPSGDHDLVQDVAALCDVAGVTLRVLPSVREIVGGRITARDFRDLRIEDLLGRQQIETDLESVSRMLRDRRVLITGAGGSIGSEIARQVVALAPASLILVDHDETHLHDLVGQLEEMTTELNLRLHLESLLADIRDQDRIFRIFVHHHPEVVFHAAAHKHVPVLESHPEEAVLTNVIGTANVADASAATDVERLVLISTDKAVRPSSVMGASKWFAEQIVRSHPSYGVSCAVRFGNVLGSRGSVIPTFLRQIERGGPVTVTDPNMLRYFMSLQEAVTLVLQAAALSTGGEVFTLEMGAPVRIYDLARKLIRLSGYVPDKDVEIAIVGVRPGEKLVEEILDVDEQPEESGHPGIIRTRPPLPDRTSLRRALKELELLAADSKREELAQRMKALANESRQPVVSGGRT